MKSGRPPSWRLAPPGPVLQEPRPVDARGRLVLPARLLNNLAWFDEVSGAECLAILEAPGRVILRPWVADSGPVLQAREALLADSTSEDNLEQLLLLEDRYAHVTIEPNGRVSLPPLVRHHLQRDGNVATLLALRLAERLELWSWDYRTHFRGGAGLPDDLP